ncbi:MAG: hypothetical protein E7368_02550 [Clostridiales bacterium]|nr:hypothetical protein [Clostridiales bacterium]
MTENEKLFQTAMKAYLLSSEVSLNDLRAYGRVIGIESPTKKTKPVLIDEIIALFLGELAPVPVSSKGAPVKNKYIQPIVLNTINKICEEYKVFEKYENVVTEEKPISEVEAYNRAFFQNRPQAVKLVLESTTPTLYDEVASHVTYKGQLHKIKEVFYLLPLNCNDGEKILISDKLVEENDLREGDIISCWVARGSSALVATQVLAVNEVLIGSFTRSRFEEGVPCYPEGKIAFCGENEENATLKYFDWVSPIRKGQRTCVIAPPKAGKTQLIYDLACSAQKNNPNVYVFVLLIDQSPETVGKFRRVFGENALVYTTYEDDIEWQAFSAEFMLKRVMRYVEHGRDVLLFVDSMNALAHAYNETDASLGGKTLAGGIESKTLQYVKRFLGTARKFETNGSLTIVGASALETGNPADELICSELTAVSNLDIRLSGELASKRIYPAIDHLQTRTGEGTECTDLDIYLRNKFLPTHGAEAFLEKLFESKTQEELLQKLK